MSALCGWLVKWREEVLGAGLVLFAFVTPPNAAEPSLPLERWPRVGLASWYAQQDPGVTPMTANGEWFSDEALTAAMWEPPFGSCIQVTHLHTLQRVAVRINDRGPHRRLVRQGRLIDLSRAAFGQVADLDDGLIPVQLDVLDADQCRARPPAIVSTPGAASSAG